MKGSEQEVPERVKPHVAETTPRAAGHLCGMAPGDISITGYDDGLN